MDAETKAEIEQLLSDALERLPTTQGPSSEVAGHVEEALEWLRRC